MNIIKSLNRRPLLFIKHYSIGVVEYFSEQRIERLKMIGMFFGILLFTGFLGFIILNNMTPLGLSVKYSLSKNSDNISSLGPKTRVQTINLDGEPAYKQTQNLIYFTTTMPFDFDHASVKVIFQNTNPNQSFSLGFQDKDSYSYKSKPVDVPYLNSLSWARNGDNPVLYQREQKFNDVNSFLDNPPLDSVIGTYEYNTNIVNNTSSIPEDYMSKKTQTKINTALRGTHVMYVYLKNEPFQLSFVKQDLNWYSGEDKMKVIIYKDTDKVFEKEIGDDGISNDSRKILSPQRVNIQNPGKELPENGVYKVVLEANGDTIIKNIRTNLQKIVFANSLFPATNSIAYHGVVSSTSATTVYTNALNISASTYHKTGIQNILVGDQVLGVHTLNTPSNLSPRDNITKVLIPQNDVILNGFMGYFAFSHEQFFVPTKYNVLPISKKEDINLVDYILTDYLPSHTEGQWQTNELYYDLNSAFIIDGKLHWVINAPKLQEANGTIIIKDIQITFHKKGWF
jgi:hypothetical protein